MFPSGIILTIKNNRKDFSLIFVLISSPILVTLFSLQFSIKKSYGRNAKFMKLTKHIEFLYIDTKIFIYFLCEKGFLLAI